MAQNLFVRRSSKVVGPVTRRQVEQSIASGKILESDQIANSAEGPWHLVGKVFGLSGSSEKSSAATMKSGPANAVAPSKGVFEQRSEPTSKSIPNDPLSNERLPQRSHGNDLLVRGPSNSQGPDEKKSQGGPRKGMSLKPGDLLPGERPLKTKFANMVVSVKESGLSRFAFDDYMGLVGMKGKEAIGGKAHLTNYRIIFKSHFFNRVRGSHSIFLPNVLDVSATLNKLVVETTVQRFEFVMWLKTSFIDAVKETKTQIDHRGLAQLKEAVLSNPKVIGTGLQKWVSLETINKVFLAGRKPHAALSSLSGIEKNAFLEIANLLQGE